APAYAPPRPQGWRPGLSCAAPSGLTSRRNQLWHPPGAARCFVQRPGRWSGPRTCVPGEVGMATTAELFALAAQHHQAGDLHQTELLCRRVLETDPDHAEARHLPGVVAYKPAHHAA